MYVMKVALDNKGMKVEASRQCTKDRKECRAMVRMQLYEFHPAIFAWPCVLSDRPPVLWWLSSGDGLHDAVGINQKSRNC